MVQQQLQQQRRAQQEQAAAAAARTAQHRKVHRRRADVAQVGPGWGDSHRCCGCCAAVLLPGRAASTAASPDRGAYCHCYIPSPVEAARCNSTSWGT
jgi:C4-dicarboxylate-specific signal transduction histidine kinase